MSAIESELITSNKFATFLKVEEELICLSAESLAYW